MIVLYYTMILFSIIFSYCNAINYFYYSKESKNHTFNFIIVKGILYLVLAIMTLIYTFFTDDSLKIGAVATICIALFEAIQNIIQGKAEKFKMKANELLEQQEMGVLKKIEFLDEFCREKLETLRRDATLANKKLVYEQIYDYLKYYEDAESFLAIFRMFINGEKTLDDVCTAETDFYGEFKNSCIEVVKVPGV